MKKVLVPALVLSSALALLGCQSAHQPSASQQQANKQPVSQQSAGQPSAKEQPATSHAPMSIRAKIEQYMNAVAKQEHFMGSILVAKGDDVIVAQGYGMADLEHHVPNTPDTEFRIGSNTKQFTAMAILMLQEQGKLDVRDKICKYVPKCPSDWQPITIYELLTHTSGIPNYTDFPDFGKIMSESLTPVQLIAVFKNKPLDFKPGAKFSYSNSGYVVLGFIIERTSGESYQQFLRQHIFDQLGMQDSGYGTNHPKGANHAKGYRYSNGKYEPAEYTDMSTPFSAGALYSTVRDLYTWDRALAAGKLIPAALQKQMFAPQVPVPGPGQTGDVHYGFGWFISKQFGYTEYSHEGGIPGFTSFNSWFPEQHVYVIVLDNMLSPTVSEIARDLAAIAFGKKYEIPEPFKAISLPREDLEKFVGTYRMPEPKMFMTITQTGDQLQTQLTGQPAFPIYPESKTHFFLKVVRAQLFFRTNSRGEVTGVVLRQGGVDHPGTRLSDVEAAKVARKNPKVIALATEALQEFVGTYQLAPGFAITISRTGDQLSAQATGQTAAMIYPESPSEFFYKVVDAQISFVTNNKGKMTGLVLHQNGRDVPGKKVK